MSARVAPAVPVERRGRGRRPDPGKREAIFRQARRLFTVRGYGGASMDEIAAAAGVAKATVYHHFGSKAQLYRSVVQELVRQLPPPEQVVGQGLQPLALRLRGIARGACMLATSPLMHDLQRLLAPRMDGLDRGGAPRWHDCVDPYREAFAALLRREGGAARLDIADPDVASEQFFSLAAGDPFIRMLMEGPPGEGRIVQHVDAAVEAFMRAYAA